MKAAFRLGRKPSTPQIRQQEERRPEKRISNTVPRLYDGSGDENPLGNMRFSGLGWDDFMTERDHDGFSDSDDGFYENANAEPGRRRRKNGDASPVHVHTTNRTSRPSPDRHAPSRRSPKQKHPQNVQNPPNSGLPAASKKNKFSNNLNSPAFNNSESTFLASNNITNFNTRTTITASASPTRNIFHDSSSTSPSQALASAARDHPSFRRFGSSQAWSADDFESREERSEEDSQADLPRNSHDKDSIRAVRNDDDNDTAHPPLSRPSNSHSPPTTPDLEKEESATMMDRHYPPQPSSHRSRAPTGSRTPSKPSVSTILESAKRANPARPSLSLASVNGPLAGNTLNSSASIHTSATGLVFPSSPGDGPPVEPSLFAYNSAYAGGRTPKKVKDSAASIHTAHTKKSTRTKSSERTTIRNARGEIEWKDAPPPPSALPLSSNYLNAPSGSQQRRTPSPYDSGSELKSRTRSSGADDRRRPPRSQPAEVPFAAIGSSSSPKDFVVPPAPRRPRNRRRSTDDADGFHTADEDDLEALEWERKRELQMEQDRLEVYRQQQARSDEERRARKREERERLAVEERQAEARAKAKREARRQVREKAEREEAERRQKHREEVEARRRKEKEEAQRRRIQAEREAEEARLQKEKEAKERRARRRQQKEEQAKREAEEAAIRAKQEAEEAIRKAEEEARRKEEERLAAIEAERLAKQAAIEQERLAKEAAIQAARDAIIEKERQLAEAKRQVEEEDRAARKAGRREDKRAQRALAAGFPAGEIDPEAQQSDDEDDEDVFDVDEDSASDDAESEVFVDAGADDDFDAEAKSATTGSMARSVSNLDAPSSTDGSSDMPATPADEKASMTMLPPPSSDEMGRQSTSSNGGHGQVKFAAGTNGGGTQTAQAPEKVAPRKSDRFRQAVRVGARRSAAAPAIAPSTSLLTATFAAAAGEDDESVEEDQQIVQPNGPYREGGITYGKGWCAHGLADPSLTIDHRRYVRVSKAQAEEESADTASAAQDFDEVMYSDLGELIFSATTPDVIARLISHLDYADVKALRQTSQSIRFALGQLAGRELVLARFLAPLGYETWKPTKLNTNDPDAAVVEKDPMPLSFSDCEAFLLSFDLLSEYALVGAEFARAPHKMDPRYPRLARATTRAYNRVLTRLRMQVNFRIPQQPRQGGSLSPNPGASSSSASTISSPWKPGRAGFFRAWVPSAEAGGWLSDTELARCERELFIAGVWPHLKKGDVVWDCAVGDGRNEGKYIFDGRYLRDLSFMFDRAGHLPSWLNAFSFAPSYYHNIVRSSDASQPVIYLDVLPWRDQIVSTMRLVQDQVETFSPQGARYRISKWLYRAVVNIVPGAIISDEGLEVVDAGWHGKLVIETEGTAEHAKELISRCAGPAESVQTKARLLASVMDADGRPKVPKAPAPTRDAQGNRIETTTPWAIVRARSRPGLIWIRPMDMRERVVF